MTTRRVAASAGLVDLEKERARLENESAELQQQIDRITKLLNSPFAQKRRPPSSEKERDKLALLESSLAEVSERLKEEAKGL